MIYESVHRFERTLEDLRNTFGEAHLIVVGRELTKKFEEIKRGSIGEMIAYFGAKEKLK